MLTMSRAIGMRKRSNQDRKESIKLIDKMFVEEIFLELSNLKAVKLDKWWRLTEITKTQRTIMEKVGYQFPIPF